MVFLWFTRRAYFGDDPSDPEFIGPFENEDDVDRWVGEYGGYESLFDREWFEGVGITKADYSPQEFLEESCERILEMSDEGEAPPCFCGEHVGEYE